MMGRLAIDALGIRSQRDASAGALMNSSEDLIDRVRRGDEEAFRLIFERYARPVISFIYDMVGQRELAEELMQETFVRAYKNLAALRDDTRFPTWLFGIAKNVAREALRTRRREDSQLNLDHPAIALMNDEAPSPAGWLLNKELNRLIRHALAALDEDKRLVFTLKIFQQRSYEEISLITGFSIAKLKVDLHRARAEMRRRLRPYLGESDEV